MGDPSELPMCTEAPIILLQTYSKGKDSLGKSGTRLHSMLNSRSPLQIPSDAERSHSESVFEDPSEWLLPNFSLSPARDLQSMNVRVDAEAHELPFSPMVESPGTETIRQSIATLFSIPPRGSLEGTEGDRPCIPRKNVQAKCLGVKRNIRSPQTKSSSLCEKNRRKCMNELFAALELLLPWAVPKNDKSSVLDEIIKYIRVLQTKVEELKRQKSILLLTSGHRLSDSNGGQDNSRIISSEPRCDVEEHSGMISPEFKSQVDVKVYDNERVVIITILSSPDETPGCLPRILEDLEVAGLVIRNFSIFRSDNAVFQHFQTKCPDASKLLSENSLKTRLQSLV